MEPQQEQQGQQRQRRWALLQVLATTAALAAAATATLPSPVDAFVVPRAPLPVAPLAAHRLGAAAGAGARARGGLWASTTQEPEPQQQEADASGPSASAASSTSSFAAGKGFGAAPKAKTGTVNKRLMNVIDAELKVVQENKGPEAPANAEDDDTDLNGINPIQPLGSAVFAGFISFLFWRITIGVATALNNVHLDTEFYPVKRMFSVASTAFVGITALGAGVIGVTALGLLGLAARVSYGIATGELDPNKKKVAPPPSAVPLDAQGLPKLTGAWYEMPKKKAEAPKPEEGPK